MTLEVWVSASTDDAEERHTGKVVTTSSDLELVFDRTGDQTVGMRFNGIDIPQGANITYAYIQFQVDDTNSVATSLTIQGEDVDNATTFTTVDGSISSRPRTAAAVSWSPVPWLTRGEVGPDQQTPNIASVIREVVNRPGWVSGNSLVIIVSGTGERTAESFDGFPAAAPLLHVEYTASGNQLPAATMSAPVHGSIFFEGESITFTGTASDFEEGDLTASLAWESDLDGQIGNGGSFSRSDLSVGVHTITATVTDTEGQTAYDSTTITVSAIGVEVLVGAGDIANCSRNDDEETAKLLDNIPGTVVTLGDNAYPNGTTAEFYDCYDSTWGRHKDRTHPAVGDNDYKTPGASPYFNYFGAAAGDPNKGYYSYDLGSWHIIVLNSNCSQIGGCGPNDPQGQWLQADLAANPSTCILAIHHEPLFSSNGGDADLRDFWVPLYEAGADIVLSGHRHMYERFAQQNPDGMADPGRGIRQFVVGTGGASLSSLDGVAPNSQVRDDNTHGVLKLTLHPASYDWEFIPIAGQMFTDSGSALCVTSSFNQAPVANDDSAGTNEDTAVIIDVTANDSDPDGNLDPTSANTDCITCSAPGNGSLVNNGYGTFIYMPNPDYNGNASFLYEICDTGLLCDTAMVSITVAAVNDPPVANDDSAGTQEDTPVTIDVALNDSDPDGNLDFTSTNTTCATCAEPASGALFNIGYGTFSYTPNSGFTGVDSFVYEICDTGLLCNTATVSITVNLANDPPVANDESASTQEDTTVTIDVAANDSDPDGNLNPDSADTTCGTCSNPTNGALVNNGDGTFDYTPDPNFNGPDSFIYEICDTLGGCDTALVSIAVASVNDSPVANDDKASTTEETLVAIDVAANDTDPDGNLDLASTKTGCPSCSDPANGTLLYNGDGTFDYTPDAGFTGNDSFIYEICDTEQVCDTARATVTVEALIIDLGVTTSSDDAEETGSSGSMDLTSRDLDLGRKMAGIRFNGVNIPQGATIHNAYIQFQADEIGSVATTLTIQGEDIDNALTFTSANGNISSRSRTTASIPWSAVPWSTVGEAGPDQQTSNIASVIQEITSRPGWISGNSLVIIITGSGNRAAVSYDRDPARAPLLHVKYSIEPLEICDDGVDNDGNGMTDCADPRCEGITTGSCDTGLSGICADGMWTCSNRLEECIPHTLPEEQPEGGLYNNCSDNLDNDCDGLVDIDLSCQSETECFDRTDNNNNGLTDCEDPDCSGVTNGLCSTGLPGICSDGMWTCSNGLEECIPGIQPEEQPEGLAYGNCKDEQDNDCDGSIDNDPECYGEIDCNDGIDNDGDGLTDCYDPDCGCPYIVEVQVLSGTDDAEEKASGSVGLSSSDLELVDEKTNQTVGMRFNGVDIPQGSTITGAYIQFQVDEVSMNASSLMIEGEAIDDAVTFASSSGNISLRIRTTASVEWIPAPWPTVGEAGEDQQTPDIASVIQEIVNRAGWTRGNSLVIIITGTGKRTAESYNGVSSAAPLLHVEYLMN